jgi:DnaJ-class molecular chaperone
MGLNMCVHCQGSGHREEYNYSGAMLGIAVLGAPIPLDGSGMYVTVQCNYCRGTGQVAQ